MMSNFLAQPSQVRQDTRSVVTSLFTSKRVEKTQQTSDTPSTSSTRSNQIPILSLKILLNPYSPWVLVKDGSFMGYFDWIPLQYRVGPWHSNSIIAIIVYAFALLYWRPQTLSIFVTTTIQTPKDDYKLWYCSVVLGLFMMINFIVMCFIRTPGIIATFTIQSWIMNTTRLGIQVFLTTDRITRFPLFACRGMIFIHNLLRFPAFATALVTFLCWNLFIGPYIYACALSTPQHRHDFIRWNFSFNLVQIHVCNIIYSFINVFLTDALISRYSLKSRDSVSYYQPFLMEDLWMSFFFLFVYALFYYLFLDRLGLHIYGPLFSPRNKLAPFVLLVLASMIFFIFSVVDRFIDGILENQRLVPVLEWERIFVFGAIKSSGLICACVIVSSWLLRRTVLLSAGSTWTKRERT